MSASTTNLFQRGTSSSSSSQKTTASSSQTNMRIGYHLIGSLNDNSLYDVTLYPNDPMHHAQINTRGESKSKTVILKNFSSTWTLQSVAKDFFTKNITVTKQGFLKGGNIEILTGRRSDVLLDRVDIRVEGVDSDQQYRLDLNTADLNLSEASVLDSKDGKYQTVIPEIYNLRHLTSSDFQTLVPNLYDRLKIEILPLMKSMRISLKPTILESNTSSTSSQIHLPARSFIPQDNNINRYCRLLDDESQYAKAIGLEMINALQKRISSKEGLSSVENELYEIGELIGKTTAAGGFQIVSDLLKKINIISFQDKATLEPFSKFLVRMQELYFQKAWKALQNQNDIMQPPKYIDSTNSSEFIEILRDLTGKLNSTDKLNTANFALITEQLKASIALLNIMALWRIDPDVLITASLTIQGFKDHPDLRISYLAEYGTQSIVLISKHSASHGETKTFFFKTFLIIKLLAQKTINEIKPWEMASLIKSSNEIQEISNESDAKKNWFIDLLTVRIMIFGTKPECFSTFIDGVCNHFQDVFQHLDVNNPSFIVGFTDLLWEVMNAPQIGSQQQDLKIKLMTIGIYKQIYETNKQQQQQTFFITDNGKRLQIQTLIIDRLQACTNHPSRSVSLAANKILSEHGIASLQRGFVSGQNFLSETLKQAINKHNPLLFTFKSINDVLLNDAQIAKEKPFFILPDAIDDYNNKEPLDKHLLNFLNDQKKNVLAIGGFGGAGKSLSIKMFATQLLENYTKEGFYPIFVSLPSLSNPFDGAISETLRNHGIKDEETKAVFLGRKIVWIFDAYDEIEIEKLSIHKLDNSNEVNIYKKNKMDSLPKQNTKIIFLYKKGSLVEPTNVFKPDNENISELTLEPFDPTKMLVYVKQFCDFYDQNSTADTNLHLPWTKDQYIKIFTELSTQLFWNFLSNPLRLKMSAEILPAIVNPNSFRGSDDDEIIRSVFTYFACVRARRSGHKMTPIGQVDAREFLRYQLKLSAAMKNYDKTLINQNMSTDETAKFSQFFLGDDARTGVANRFFAKECLEEEVINQQKFWKFISNDYLDFLHGMSARWETDDESEDIENVLNETITLQRFNELYGYE